MDIKDKEISYEVEKITKEVDRLTKEVEKITEEIDIKPWEKIFIIFCIIVMVLLIKCVVF